MEQNNNSKGESKYERLRRIGIGSYGIVFKCVNRQTGQIVAIKRYSENDSDPTIRKIAMREVRMLRQLKHPNLINLIEVFRRKRRLHLVFDYCELTVLDVIEKYGNSCPLNLIRKIVWQIVNGTSYCHSRNCIHRDIKPENILINQAGVVKLCDFGFARAIDKPTSGESDAKPLIGNEALGALTESCNLVEEGGVGVDKENISAVEIEPESTANAVADRQALTEYVATRWYRAPELLIGEIYYDAKIDIWAIGCVTAELMRGDPIWPGKTDLDQLLIIKNSLGQLTPTQTNTLVARGIYDQMNTNRLLESRQIPGESVDGKLPSRVGDVGIDFVSVCLQMDPKQRPTCEQLLRHEYIHSARMTQFVKGTAAGSTSMISSSRNMTLAPISEAETPTPTPTTQHYRHQHHQYRRSPQAFNGSQIHERSNSQSLLVATTKSPMAIQIASSKRLSTMAPRQLEHYGAKKEPDTPHKKQTNHQLTKTNDMSHANKSPSRSINNKLEPKSLLPVAKTRGQSLGFKCLDETTDGKTANSIKKNGVPSPTKQLYQVHNLQRIPNNSEISPAKYYNRQNVQNFESFNKRLLETTTGLDTKKSEVSLRNKTLAKTDGQPIQTSRATPIEHFRAKKSANGGSTLTTDSSSASTQDSNRSIPKLRRSDNRLQDDRKQENSRPLASDQSAYDTQLPKVVTRQLTRQITKNLENGCFYGNVV